MNALRLFWFSVGIISFGLAMIGAFLPILPTVPFLLLAALGFSKSSNRVHNWLISHDIFGPPIKDWQQSGAINQRVKIFASLSILASIGLTVYLSVPVFVLGLQVIILAIVAIFIWTRPNS